MGGKHNGHTNRHQQPGAGPHPDPARPLSAAPSCRRIRGPAAELRRVQHGRESLGQCADGPRRRPRRSRGDAAAQLSGGARNLLGLREARRGGRAALGAAAGGRAGVAAVRRPAACDRLDGLLRRNARESAAASRLHARAHGRAGRWRDAGHAGLCPPGRGSQRRRARRRGAGRRPGDPDVHQRHDRPAQGHHAHAFHPGDVCRAVRLVLPHDAGKQGPADRRPGVQRRDGHHAARLLLRRELFPAPAVRSAGDGRGDREGAHHAHHGGAVAAHRPAEPAGIRSGEARLARDDPVARRAIAAGPQGHAGPRAARPALRALRRHRGLHHRARPRRCRAQGGIGRRAGAVLRDAHPRRAGSRMRRRRESARSSAAGR